MPLDNNGNKLDILLYSLAVGLAIGVLYTVFKLIYSIMCEYGLSKKTRTALRFVLDILFSILYNLIIVVFVFGANSGVVRSYILFFSFMGAVIYELTIGKLIYNVLLLMLKFIVRISQKTVRMLCKPLKILLRVVSERYYSDIVQKNIYKRLNGGLE